MIEWILLYLLTWPAFVVLVVISLILEWNNQHATSAFVVCVIGLVVWKLFSIPDTMMLWGAVAYFPLGMGWTVWRWRVHCKETVRKANEYEHTHTNAGVNSNNYTPNEYTHNGVMHRVNPKNNADKLISWVIGWPASVIHRTLEDIVHMIRVVIAEWFGSVFERIATSAVSKLEVQAGKED